MGGFFMNESYEMLLKRRAIRAFKPDAIPEDTMNRIILAGKYAPSTMVCKTGTSRL